jgi:hypothetical protein
VLRGFDNRSFLGGQWMVEMQLIAMGTASGTESWVEFMTPWSIKEGDCTNGFGFISSCNTDPKRPSYWHYKMVADNFSGATFYPVTAESGNTNNHVKVYSCKAGSNIRILVLNQATNSTQSDASTKSITLRLSNTTPTGAADYKFRTTASVPGMSVSEITIPGIHNESSHLYEYNASGTLVNECYYKLYGSNALVYTCAASCTTPATPTASSNSPVCQSNTINLSAPTIAGVTYFWQGPDGWTSTLEDPTRSGATVAMAGTYTVTVTTTSGGCTASSTTFVDVPDFASIGAGGSTTFCSGGSVTLYAATGTGYTWQWIKNGTNISGATANNYTATTAGSYQVKITKNSGACSAWSSPTTVTINNSLVATITPTGPTSFCTGGNVVLAANTCSGYTYQWQKKDANGVYQPISGATSANYTATTSGWYQVRVTSGVSNAWSSGIEVTASACRLGAAEEAEQAPAEAALSVFPNPTSGEFTLSLDGVNTEGKVVQVEVMNPVGQVVYTTSDFAVDGSKMMTQIALSGDCADGIYIIRVKVGEEVMFRKIVLSR